MTCRAITYVVTKSVDLDNNHTLIANTWFECTQFLLMWKPYFVLMNPLGSVETYSLAFFHTCGNVFQSQDNLDYFPTHFFYHVLTLVVSLRYHVTTITNDQLLWVQGIGTIHISCLRNKHQNIWILHGILFLELKKKLWQIAVSKPFRPLGTQVITLWYKRMGRKNCHSMKTKIFAYKLYKFDLTMDLKTMNSYFWTIHRW
jgi:hypothetical protein